MLIGIFLNFLKSKIGIGKTEIGIIFHLLFMALYVLPLAGWLTWDMLINIQVVIGAFTGSSFLGRIQDKEAFFKALQSVFFQWGKKK